MFTLLLLALASVPSTQQLEVRGPDGWHDVQAARLDDAEHPTLVLPLVSRSERVARAHFGRDGLELRDAGGARPVPRRLRAIDHAPDAQVLVAEGEAWVVGPPMLPRDVQYVPKGGRALAVVARRDGVGAGSDLRVEAPDEAPGTLVLIDVSGRVRLRETAEAEQVPRDVDQVFYAEVSAVGERLIELEFTTDPGVFPTEDAPPEGLTRTYLLEVEVRDAEGSPAAAAEREPAGFLVDRRAVTISHLEGPDLQLDIRPTMGPGLAWGDVDGDGRVDLYVVQGGGREGSALEGNVLLLNSGVDFSVSAHGTGAEDTGAGMGALFFDAEGDGDLDLYVANYGPDALYLNDGRGRFRKCEDCGIPVDGRWSAGVAAADFDGDGDLDLYVSSYLDYDVTKMPPVEDLPQFRREDPIEMLPFAFPGERNTLLRNVTTGDGPPRFEDATDELKVADVQGRGMQPLFWDFDRDGDQDLYQANDVSFNVLWRNEGDGTLRDISFLTGMDDPRGGMGVAVGDVDGDGDEDLFLTNWQLEANALYVNNLLSHRSRRTRVATFRDGTVKAGLGPAGIGVTSWSAELCDLDNDGDLDLYYVNGYTSPDYESTGICVGQPNHLFWNDGEGRFTDGTHDAGPDFARPLASRASATCDYDLDGKLDLAITSNNGPFQLLKNEHPNDHSWLIVRLRAKGRNTHAIGAEVTITAGRQTWRRTLRAGTGYLAGNAPELHFGLGSFEEIEAVEVRWPSGKTSRHEIDDLNRVVTLEQP